MVPGQNGREFAFSWKKTFVFSFKFHWSLFLTALLIACQYWLMYGLETEQATSQYLGQWYTSSLTLFGVTWPQNINIYWFPTSTKMTVPFHSLEPGQNGRHFADDSFKRIYVNEFVCILIRISLRFVSEGHGPGHGNRSQFQSLDRTMVYQFSSSNQNFLGNAIFRTWKVVFLIL